MTPVPDILRPLLAYLPAVCIASVLVGLILALNRYTSHRRLTTDVRRTIVPQLLMVFLAALGIVLIVTSLPLTETTRGQMLALVGVAFTGIIALSSTTFFTNALAGLMLRLIRHFRAGDFIQINDLFGRITERGLFHIEIQTTERNLTTLPNLYLVSNPHTVVRASGTIISTSLSLGYDVDHRKIETLLMTAATEISLQEPFVQVTELGDFSVTYKVSGFLAEVKQLIAARSNLRRKILDVLHHAGVEIVSPRFMNQRLLDKTQAIIPPVEEAATILPEKEVAPPGEVIFDKAETAEKVALLRDRLADLAEKRKAFAKRKDGKAKAALARIDAAIAKIEGGIERTSQALEADEVKPS
jgi:small conductance mechanosensitive channel